MLKIEEVEVVGLNAVIRGMRNPMNSWEKIDSYNDDNGYIIGENDFKLMKQLRNAGNDHRKFMRMMVVYLDITAPLYWWKEFDTYKVGTVSNSCSTMHKIHEREFGMDDFSTEHLETIARMDEDNIPHKPYMVMKSIIDCLNACRESYIKTKSKTDWWQMIQLLPSSYNQKRTIMLNYEVLSNMYKSRKNHKLDEWHTFCDWIKELPYSVLITGDN
jgi:hypothetical protein